MKILNKLQKLIAHEQSARSIGNLDEANHFARRIQSLLDKHNLSMSEVELKVAQESPVDIEAVGETLGNVETWQIALLKRIAQTNGCYALSHKEQGFQVVIGRQIDRQITINLYQYFENLGQDLADKYLKNREIAVSGIYAEMFRSLDSTSDETRRTSFLMGFVATVCQRLEETAAQNATASENTGALVLVGKKEKENQEWIDTNLNVEKRDADTTKFDKTAFARGASSGNKIALTDKTLEK